MGKRLRNTDRLDVNDAVLTQLTKVCTKAPDGGIAVYAKDWNDDMVFMTVYDLIHSKLVEPERFTVGDVKALRHLRFGPTRTHNVRKPEPEMSAVSVVETLHRIEDEAIARHNAAFAALHRRMDAMSALLQKFLEPGSPQ
jgi:hypothetical protein